MLKLTIALLFTFFTTLCFSFQNFWAEVNSNSVIADGERRIIPQVYRTYAFNLEGFKSYLFNAPHEKNVVLRNSNFIVILPLPDGRTERFRIVEYSLLLEALQSKYPEIRTYYGEGLDNPSLSVRFDITYKGFRAMYFTEEGMAFIDPYSTGTKRFYNVYYKKYCTSKNAGLFECTLLGADDNRKTELPEVFSIGETLRTYRLALACTHQYAAYHGNTKPLVMSEFTTAMNRVNGVYEKDVAGRMVFVPNNDTLIFIGSSPYTNNNGNAMLSQNQIVCDTRIGNPNYDIGHVFSTGGGGVAYLNSLCNNPIKAGGVTGQPDPIGDPFYIDYVSHEIGHQFGGNHTFNGTGCGGQRFASTAYEPGSASTIQGYAGICGSDDLQLNSDKYFHYISIQEIRDHMTSTSCAQTSSTGNSDPVVNVPSGGFYIPKQTPFSLTGSASDPDNDPLFYCWEEWDLGPACPWNNPTGTAPTFRSWTAGSNPTRIFPRLQNLLNNTTAIGEFFPAYSRILTFRLTVRDNRAGGGGVGTALMSPINIDANSGPFLVTFPNTPVTIGGGQHIQWNVAGTNNAPVNCANVNILLSTDGGYNWPITLKSNTANDGIEFVNLPAVQTNQARIKIEAVGNIFFDISNTNFTIDLSLGITEHSTPIKFMLTQNFPNPFNPVTTIRYGIPEMSYVTLKVYDITGKLINTLIDNELKTEGYYNIELDATELPSGLYIYTLQAGKFIESKKMVIVK